MEITLKIELGKNGIVYKTFMSFKSRHQLPLVMIIREHLVYDGIAWIVEHADCLYSSRW